jgi:hypothetical protein
VFYIDLLRKTFFIPNKFGMPLDEVVPLLFDLWICLICGFGLGSWITDLSRGQWDLGCASA